MLEHHNANNIHMWVDLKHIFIGNFKHICVPPKIPRISRPTNKNQDVIERAHLWHNYEALVNELGCNKPWMMRELLDLTTSHASSQKAV